MAETTVDLYAAGFDALVKRLDKCISVGGGYIQKQMFLPGSNISYILYPFVTYLLCPLYLASVEAMQWVLLYLSIGHDGHDRCCLEHLAQYGQNISEHHHACTTSVL
jgi:hypothetical protein